MESSMYWLTRWFFKRPQASRPARPARRPRLGVEALEDRLTPSITIQIDYSHDVNNFFRGHADRQAALQFAANAIGSQLNDNLAAITPDLTPGVGNHWTIQPVDPSNINQTFQVTDLNVPANTIILYAGGTTTLPAGDTGWGGPGGAWTASSNAFATTLTARGQAGTGWQVPAAAQTDFGPWGGTISFQTTFSGWDFGLNPSRTLAPGSMDFVSAAEHEIGHVLGVGTAASWMNKVGNGLFTGQAAMNEFGNGTPTAVPLGTDLMHWQIGVTDHGVPVTMAQRQAALSRFTALDFAALQDIGWQVTPATPTPPAIPTVTGPTGTVATAMPTITWTASAGAVRYELLVNDWSTGQQGIIWQQNLTGLSFTPSVPLNGGWYEVWVRAYNSSGQASAWSPDGQYFYVSLPTPTLLAPASSSNPTPTINWTAATGAVSYEVYIANATTGAFVLDQPNVTSLSFTPGVGLASGTYRVWVRAVFSDGSASDWWGAGAWQDFTVL
jgi:hypothetical protein